MISVLLIVLVILAIISRRLDIDLDINETESFDPITEDEAEEVVEVEEDYYPEYFKSKRRLTLDELYYKDIKRKCSKRGKSGHKGYTKIQTLAYKKAREFKTSHLNEWC